MSADDIFSAMRLEHLLTEGRTESIQRAYSYIKEAKFYLNTMGKFIDEQEAKDVEQLIQPVKHLSSEQQFGYLTWHYPYWWDQIFRSHLCSGFIVMLVAFTEATVKETCRDIAEIKNTPEKPEEWDRNVFKNARSFVTKYVNAPKSLSTAWDFLNDLYQLRNVLVHYQGFYGVYRKREQIHRLVQAFPGIEESNKHIEIQKEFCELALDRVRDILDGLHTEELWRKN